MATCPRCSGVMPFARTCARGRYVADDGRSYAPRRHLKATYVPLPPGEPWKARCGDCGVDLGGVHHEGCDLERCPRCRRQLITCECALTWRADPEAPTRAGGVAHGDRSARTDLPANREEG